MDSMTHLPHSKNILGYMPLHYSNSVKVTALNMFKKKKKKKKTSVNTPLKSESPVWTLFCFFG